MRISKGMVVAAAAIAFGLVTVDDMAKGFTAQPFVAAQAATTDAIVVQNGALRIQAAATLRSLVERQEAGQTPAEAAMSPRCREQSWPYYSTDCLVRGDGSHIASAVRIVGIDRVASGPVRTARLQ